MKEMLHGKKWLQAVLLVVVLLVCGGLYVGFTGKPQSYKTMTAGYGDAAEIVEATGTVRGADEKTYYAEVTAPIASMDIEVGDSVDAGIQIVSYDLTDLNRAYEQALITSESSENGVNAKLTESNKNASKYAQASTDEQIYQYLYALSRADANGLEQDQYTKAYYVQCAYDGLSKSIADKSKQVAQKTSELAHIEDKTSEAYKNLSQEIADLNVSITSMQKDQANLPNTDLTPDENAHYTYDANLMEDITRNWTQATTDANTAEPQILNEYQKEQLEKSHELTQLSVQTATENLEKAQTGVTTEFYGIVTKVLVEEGAVVTKGMPLFALENAESMRVDVELSKYDIGKVAVGQPAEIEIAGSSYTGSVSKLKRLAQTDASDKAKVTVEVTIDHPDDSILLGIEADVDIHTQEKENVLLIPTEAYYSDDNGEYCYVIADGCVTKKYFTTGVETDDVVEVLDGIAEGDVVITDAVTDDMVGKKAVSAK